MNRQPRRGTRSSSFLLRAFLLGLALILFLLETVGLVELDLSSTSPLHEGSVESPVSGEYRGSAAQVYFTTPLLQGGKAGYREDLDERMAAEIERAQMSVDIAAYELNLDSITHALLAAHRRRVRVRLVTDSHSSDEPAVQRLYQAGVPVVENRREALMHHKFVVLDGEVVWTGSWNLTVNDTYRNHNNSIRIVSSMLAENYTTEFEEMFISHTFGPDSLPNTPYPHIVLCDSGAGSEIELANYFAPEDQVADQIIALLQDARSSIRFMAFSFTDDQIGQVLVEKARSGLIVQGVFEKRNSGSEFSEYNRLQRAGLDVLTDANPYIMHHKVFILDDQIVVTGSYNFTKNAALFNDENLLVIRSPAIAAEYQAEFERIYTQAATVAQSSG